MSVLSDFEWSWTAVRVRETGAEISFSRSLLYDVWRGGLYIVAESLRTTFVPRPKTLRAAFYPRRPRPWYLLWGATRVAGITSGSRAEFGVGFSDLTHVASAGNALALTLNGNCTDISKTKVAQTFEAVFGYTLEIDPRRPDGPFVEKSELNGVHDGQIKRNATDPKPGYAYQRLIDNETEDGTVLDLRCPTVFGTIPLVYLKERPVARRFDNYNARAQLSTTHAHFSADELVKISHFCTAMGLDWGGLDILRDRESQRIYIVDVNKTDMGPPLALPLRYKLASTKILGQALRAGLLARLKPAQSDQKAA